MPKKITLFLCSGIAAVALSLMLAPVTEAATLGISPSTGSYPTGQTFTASVFLSSPTAANAISGTLRFPVEHMNVVSIDHSTSIASFWIQEPSFSNSDGTINFEGVVLNPGFTGTGGRIFTVTFRLRSAGNATVRFSSGAVLANDGQGTNLLQDFGNASYAVQEKVSVPVSPPPAKSAPPSQVSAAGDVVPPSILSFVQAEPRSLSDAKPVFLWKASDIGSSLDRLDAQVDNGEWLSLSLGLDHFSLPPQLPGMHTITLRATDRAGNASVKSLSFFIEGLETPIIEDVLYLGSQKNVMSSVLLTGRSFPGAHLIVQFMHGDEALETSGRADDTGEWAVAYRSSLDPGTWQVRVQAQDSESGRSEWTGFQEVYVSSRWDLMFDFLPNFLMALGILLGIAALAAGGYLLTHHGLMHHARLKRQRSLFQENGRV